MELEIEQRSRFTLLKGIFLGVFLGLVFLLGPIYVTDWVYTKGVMQVISLVGIAGVFIIPIEVERITGSQFQRALKLAAVVIWLILMFLFFTGRLPDYYQGFLWVFVLFLPIYWAVILTVSYCVGVVFVGSMEQDEAKKRLRLKYWSIVALFLVGCVATEGIIRFRDERIMLRESARITKHLGISLPPDLHWSSEFGSATSYLSGFEHPSMPPSSRMIGTSDDVTVKIWFRSNRMQDLYINTSIKPFKLISKNDVLRVLRSCAVIKGMKLDQWIICENDLVIDGKGYRSLTLGYAPRKTKTGSYQLDKVFPYGNRSRIDVNRSGTLKIFLEVGSY